MTFSITLQSGCKDYGNTAPTGHYERMTPENLGEEHYHLARYLFAAHWAFGRRALDLCCGLGYGSGILAAAGAREVTGVDIDAGAVAEAARRFGNDRVRFLQADVTGGAAWPPADLAVCFEGIEHVVEPEVLLEKITQALSADGVAIISTPNGGSCPKGHSGNPYHLREYRLEEFRNLLGAHFGEVDMLFQWPSGDPYACRPSLAGFLKAMIPIPVKRALHSLLGRQRRLAPSFAPSQQLPTYSYRPLPLRYLTRWPGLRHAQPSIWVAVCQRPRKLAGRVSA
jgi:2-polyprenyl-3-methyl-5-hydroxy-6-metoxy-1,4-benzoquinol methylase